MKLVGNTKKYCTERLNGIKHVYIHVRNCFVNAVVLCSRNDFSEKTAKDVINCSSAKQLYGRMKAFLCGQGCVNKDG